MPFTVITLTNVPNSLRGDLTRWMQEIATGVYVGNFNSRVREYLWKRILDMVGDGSATISYAHRNEIGYSFLTCNTERQKIDFEGIPLVLLPIENSSKEKNLKGEGRHYIEKSQSHIIQHKNDHSTLRLPEKVDDCKELLEQDNLDLVFLDIETTGLNADVDQIIEIGAIKISKGIQYNFHRMIHIGIPVPAIVQKITKITDEMLKNGAELKSCIKEFQEFVKGAMLVGYNISFDLKFLNKALENNYSERFHNKTKDLMYKAKKLNISQANYKFETTLKFYGIEQNVEHRAFEDAKLLYTLYKKMYKLNNETKFEQRN